MQSDKGDSVTGWIRCLGTTRHEDASRLLGDRSFARIARLAQGRLRAASRGPDDGEDVALSVLDSFFRGAVAGRFDRLDSREDLWRLLVAIASHKASNATRDGLRQRRGGLVDFDDARILVEVAGAEPSPEFAALVADKRWLAEEIS